MADNSPIRSAQEAHMRYWKLMDMERRDEDRDNVRTQLWILKLNKLRGGKDRGESLESELCYEALQREHLGEPYKL